MKQSFLGIEAQGKYALLQEGSACTTMNNLLRYERETDVVRYLTDFLLF